MKMTRRTRFFSLLIVAIVFAQNAGAIPVGGVLHDSYSETFDTGFGLAVVDCEVYEYTSGVYTDKYVYSYQISTIDSGLEISFFSVGILDGANAYDPDFEVLVGVTSPAEWAVVGSPPQSVEALFTSTINNMFSSTRLWFVSDYSSTVGNGALFGRLSGVPCYATGDSLTPTPEPATLALFGIGALITTLTRKRRFA